MIRPFIILLCFVSMWATSSGQAADPVKIDTYLETLCPDSINFVQNQLAPTYAELEDIMAVDIYAYGFASEVPNNGGYNFTCQHGPRECQGNKMLACARSILTDHSVYVDFAICVMNENDPPSAGQKCADLSGIDFTPIDDCQFSKEGENLLHDIGLIQNSLDPAVNYVPWIIINNIFTDENLDAAQSDLKTLVCNTYTGTPPDACLAK